MEIKNKLKSNSKEIISIILTILYLNIIINIEKNFCALVDCLGGTIEPTTNYVKYSLFPNCCNSLSFLDLIKEYIFSVFIPFILIYLIILLVYYLISKFKK
jgi:hypothetical protein